MDLLQPLCQEFATTSLVEISQEFATVVCQGLVRDLLQLVWQGLIRDLLQLVFQGLGKDLLQTFCQVLAKGLLQTFCQGLATQQFPRQLATYNLVMVQCPRQFLTNLSLNRFARDYLGIVPSQIWKFVAVIIATVRLVKHFDLSNPQTWSLHLPNFLLLLSHTIFDYQSFKHLQAIIHFIYFDLQTILINSLTLLYLLNVLFKLSTVFTCRQRLTCLVECFVIIKTSLVIGVV